MYDFDIVASGQCLINTIWKFVDLVISVHEDWFAARCSNTTQPAGNYVLVAM